MEYREELRARVLTKLEDIKAKLLTNEPMPEDREQDVDLMVEIGDHLEEILNNWYY